MHHKQGLHADSGEMSYCTLQSSRDGANIIFDPSQINQMVDPRLSRCEYDLGLISSVVYLAYDLLSAPLTFGGPVRRWNVSEDGVELKGLQ